MLIQSTKSYGVERLKILVYGQPGAGKTRLAATIGEPTLMISAEAGLLSLKDFDIPVADITLDESGQLLPKEKRFDRLFEYYNYLLTQDAQNKFKWVVIDSLTEIGQNLVEKLKAKYTDKSDTLKLWGEYSDTMRALIKAFRDIPYYNVIFTALSEKDKDESGVYFTGVALQGKISQQVPAMFDEVLYYSLSKDPNGKTVRKLITKEQDNLVSKDRSGALEVFEEPDMAKIITKIRGGKKQ